MKLQFAKDLPFKIKSTLFDFVINSFVGKEEVVAPVVFEQQMYSQLQSNAPMNQNYSEVNFPANFYSFVGQGQGQQMIPQIPQRNRSLQRKTSEAFCRSES